MNNPTEILTTAPALRAWRKLTDLDLATLRFYGARKPREFIRRADAEKKIGCGSGSLHRTLAKLQRMGVITMPQAIGPLGSKCRIHSCVTLTELGETLAHMTGYAYT